jgi:hypothetical protein
MPGKFKILMICIILSVFPGTNITYAQMLQDSNTSNLIKKNIDCISMVRYKKDIIKRQFCPSF